MTGIGPIQEIHTGTICAMHNCGAGTRLLRGSRNWKRSRLMTLILEASATDLSDLSIRELGTLLATRKVSPVEVTEAALTRIAAIDAKVHSFITVTADEARLQARRSEARHMQGKAIGPFDGIPFALKDNIETKGILSTSHSKLLIDNVPGE